MVAAIRIMTTLGTATAAIAIAVIAIAAIATAAMAIAAIAIRIIRPIGVQGDKDHWRPLVVNQNQSVLQSIIFSSLTFLL